MQHNLNLLLPESKGISSEWKFADLKIDEINSANMDSDMLTQNDRSSSVESLESFYNKPEADQSEAEQIMSANVIDVLNKDTKNYAFIAKDCSNEDEWVCDKIANKIILSYSCVRYTRQSETKNIFIQFDFEFSDCLTMIL